MTGTVLPADWLCVCIARQVQDGDVLAQGINTPLVMAGYVLALLTHAPRAVLAPAHVQGFVRGWGPVSATRAEDVWLPRALNSIGFGGVVAEFLPTYQPKEFLRPAQIDARGHTNNIALGADPRRPMLRLPGAGGIADISGHGPTYLYVPRHSRAVFVPRVDVVSGAAHDVARGTGPVYLVSDLGQFDWGGAGGTLRLTHTHGAGTPALVQQRTGFPVVVAPGCTPTPPPSAEELRLLREVIDPCGVRHLETMAGAARKRALRAIVLAEAGDDGSAPPSQNGRAS